MREQSVNDVLKLIEQGKQLKQENAGLKEDLAALQQENEDLKETRVLLRQDNRELKEAKAELEQELAAMEESYKASRRENLDLKEELSVMKKKSEKEIALLNDENQALQEQLNAINDYVTAALQDADEPVSAASASPKKKQETESSKKKKQEKQQPAKSKPEPEETQEAEFEEIEEDFEQEPKPVKPAPAAPKETKAAKPAPKPVQEEETYGIFPYADDIYQMGRNDFMFSYNTILQLDKDDKPVKRVELMLIPLSATVKYPKIMAWQVTAQGDPETVIFDSMQNQQMAIDGISLVVSAYMSGNELKTEIEAPNHPEVKISIKNMGTGGHLYKTFNKGHLHMCPVTFRNNEETGYADFVFCYEDDKGNVPICGDTMSGPIYLQDKTGVEKCIMAKWQDSVLFGAIMDVAEEE